MGNRLDGMSRYGSWWNIRNMRSIRLIRRHTIGLGRLGIGCVTGHAVSCQEAAHTSYVKHTHKQVEY